MNPSFTISELARSTWHDFLRARRGLFIFDLLFKLGQAWLVVPAVAVLLTAILAVAGYLAVSNWDMINFLLRPIGLVYAALFGTMIVAMLLFEQAGIMVLTALKGRDQRPTIPQMVRAVLVKLYCIIPLGAILVGLLALTCIPFVLLAILTQQIFLSQHDMYFYINDRPPDFWIAAGIGVLLLLAALAVAMWLQVRWALTLPIVLFENQPARAALRASAERVRGMGWQVGLVLFGWLFVSLLLGAALEVAFRQLAATTLASFGERPVVPILALLLIQGSLLATWSFAMVVGHALITRRLYLLRGEQLGLNCPDTLGTAQAEQKPIPPWNWRLLLLSLPLFLLAPVLLWADLSRYVKAGPDVYVTAHRGHARVAPENTLSAIRKAIDSGADYAEIDVQLTADGVIVLLHDRDLMRVAGDPRRLEDLRYEEVRQLDVGSWFDPKFAAERVPTLAEVIDLARGRIKLNIELKFYGPDRRLAQEVAQLVHEKDFESESIVTSMNYDALEEVKRHNPKLRTGLIVAQALGDVNRLDMDLLSVRADILSDAMLRAAHRRGREVHVWTVNDPAQMSRLIQRGVDNILTSDPDLAIRVRDEWANLTSSERLLLTSRLLLGLEPQ